MYLRHFFSVLATSWQVWESSWSIWDTSCYIWEPTLMYLRFPDVLESLQDLFKILHDILDTLLKTLLNLFETLPDMFEILLEVFGFLSLSLSLRCLLTCFTSSSWLLWEPSRLEEIPDVLFETLSLCLQHFLISLLLYLMIRFLLIYLTFFTLSVVSETLPFCLRPLLTYL